MNVGTEPDFVISILERCLAREAVVSRETSRYPRRLFLGSVSRCFGSLGHLQELRVAIVGSFLVASDIAWQGKGHHMITPPLTTASQARQRSTASPPKTYCDRRSSTL